MSDRPLPTDPLPEALQACLVALDDRKAMDVALLDVRGISSITDYLLIASGNSEPHLKALMESVAQYLKDNKVTTMGTDYNPGSGWAVVDAFDFMVHIFLPEQRNLYQLERLWRDAPRLQTQAASPQDNVRQ